MKTTIPQHQKMIKVQVQMINFLKMKSTYAMTPAAVLVRGETQQTLLKRTLAKDQFLTIGSESVDVRKFVYKSTMPKVR